MADRKLFYLTIFVTILLLVTSIYFYQRTEYLNTRLETLGNNVIYYCNSLSKEQFEINQFKQDSYIRQQERDTNLLLAVFAVAVTITGASVYKISDERIRRLKNEYDKKIEGYESKYKVSHAFIEKTRADFNYETYLSRMIEAHRAEDDNEPLSVYLSLSGLTYLASFRAYIHQHDKDESSNLLSKLISELNYISDFIGDRQLVMIGIDRHRVDGCIKVLLNIGDDKIRDLLFKISLRIKYSDV